MLERGSRKLSAVSEAPRLTQHSAGQSVCSRPEGAIRRALGSQWAEGCPGKTTMKEKGPTVTLHPATCLTQGFQDCRNTAAQDEGSQGWENAKA